MGTSWCASSVHTKPIRIAHVQMETKNGAKLMLRGKGFKNKRITNEKTTALEFRAVFLMLSFQCLRELERITSFETQDDVKSFFGYPQGLLTPCFEKSRTLEFTGFAVSVFSNSFDAFLKITSFSVCLHAYIWAPMMLNKCSYSRVELYIFACDLLSQKLFINIFRFRKTCL